jgi:hypothetical protein
MGAANSSVARFFVKRKASMVKTMLNSRAE